MQEWEYKWVWVQWVEPGKKREKVATLVEGGWEGQEEVKRAGREGWEPVSVQPFTITFGGELWAGGPSGSTTSSYLFFFRRLPTYT